MNSNYCYEQCEKGKTFAAEAIWKCESGFDAVFEVNCFIKECFETCPYKEFHKERPQNDEF